MKKINLKKNCNLLEFKRITFKMSKKLTQTEKDNRAFAKMNKARKRVAIAKDVLLQIARKKFVPTRGTYFYGKVKKAKEFNDNSELKDVLNQVKKCSVCAIGGVFACAVQKADKLKLKDLYDGTLCYSQLEIDDIDMRSYLRQWFSRTQLEHIEDAFEATNSLYLPDEYDSKVRMETIMKNIIRNKGTFVRKDEEDSCEQMKENFDEFASKDYYDTGDA